MIVKLIASDMDGTLLNDEKEVSDRTLDAIAKAKEKGILFSIATGRNITGIQNYITRIKPTGPIICNNGAVIMSADGTQTLYRKLMEREDAEEVIRLGIEFDTTLIIWSDNVFYTNKLNDGSYGYEKFSNLKPVLTTNYQKLLEQGITKILFSDKPEKIDEYLAQLARRKEKREGVELKNTTMCKSLPFFLEFFNSGVSKGKSIEFIADYLGIRKNEIMAFGDAMNDMPMILEAGCGVAMANACDEVRRAADIVTDSNNEHGVAKIIESIL